MIGICSKCGSYEWDKEVKDGKITCPKCGHTWEYQAFPLYILSGCSGVGKTTTALEIMKRKVDFVVLDADVFSGFMPMATDEDYESWVELIEHISKSIMQSGRPVLWTIAGCLDKFNHMYNRRFFTDIHCLVLVCDEELLKIRMSEGRGITDANWIKGSVDYNNYLKTHNTLGDMTYETLDISNKTVEQVADYVIKWVLERK